MWNEIKIAGLGFIAFWKFPISQLVSSTLIGLVWGYAYVKRGYETAVLAHAFSDWIPDILFSRA